MTEKIKNILSDNTSIGMGIVVLLLSFAAAFAAMWTNNQNLSDSFHEIKINFNDTFKEIKEQFKNIDEKQRVQEKNQYETSQEVAIIKELINTKLAFIKD